MSNSRVYFLQFLLDASVLPEVITTVQDNESEVLSDVFHLTRSWCFAMHRERAKNHVEVLKVGQGEP